MSFQITVQPSGRNFQTDAGEAILAAGIRLLIARRSLLRFTAGSASRTPQTK